MSMSSIPSSSPGGKRYGWVEKIGNKVPHPFLLFIYLIAVLIAATAILSALNVGVQNPTDGSRGGGQKPAQRGRIALVFAECD
ncbi:transporter [Klebsiella pneumoniae]|nr:transporter [Klebsiella pneumoniae]